MIIWNPMLVHYLAGKELISINLIFINLSNKPKKDQFMICTNLM